MMKGQNAGERGTGVSGRVCVCLCVVLLTEKTQETRT